MSFTPPPAAPFSAVFPSSSPEVAELKVPELKTLLKLLGQPGYSAPLEELRPSPKTPQAELLAIAQSLEAQGWVDYQSQIERFGISPRGRSLFQLELAARPVTPDEWRILQSCQKGPISVAQISAKVPPSQQ
jgi:hypothetical protein